MLLIAPVGLLRSGTKCRKNECVPATFGMVKVTVPFPLFVMREPASRHALDSLPSYTKFADGFVPPAGLQTRVAPGGAPPVTIRTLSHTFPWTVLCR